MFREYVQNGRRVEALRELKTDVVREFNRQVIDRKGVLFSIPTPINCPSQAERTRRETEW
jgi:hypothetical protein